MQRLVQGVPPAPRTEVRMYVLLQVRRCVPKVSRVSSSLHVLPGGRKESGELSARSALAARDALCFRLWVPWILHL